MKETIATGILISLICLALHYLHVSHNDYISSFSAVRVPSSDLTISTTNLIESMMRKQTRILAENSISSSETPSDGTDILTQPIALIKCPNQTKCIQPALQLQYKFNVYYCKHVSQGGIRFYFLIREGLLLHPGINLVDDPEKADYIVYLPESAHWSISECARPEYFPRLVVMDETDGPELFSPPEAPSNTNWYMLYFKRSFVRRRGGVFKSYMPYLEKQPYVLPMTYSIAEAYVRPSFARMSERPTDILCTLRDDEARSRVKNFVREYAKLNQLQNASVGQVNSASRPVISTGYFDKMHTSQIIVTANPSGWEGDFRFMEAMASGALVFVDHMHTPRPHELIDEKHVVYYDNEDKKALFAKLDKYRKNKALARQVAIEGYLHAMKYHRAANLIDYVFRSVHAKKCEVEAQAECSPPATPYRETGQELRGRALREKK